ncbi:MAG: isoleucine--tRNA ligase [Erysipelotrichaceae bacterium]|jgi:isoleucyl-tRNA synthetase|nr:isoleucine--tRNA ligase [Bacillota bacterium]
MKDYKDTLLMPNTEFEMRGNLPKKEPLILEKWEKDNYYEKFLKAHEGEPYFVLHDGPPYANGNLHAGTAMNRVIKDFIVRTHAMNGYYTPFFPGWDTHGLPIENAVQKLGIDRKKLSPAKFRQKCEEYAYKQIAIQMDTEKRLGEIGDYENPYITLTKDFEQRQIQAFAKMAMDGLIYQGLKPIHWSPYAETAVADSEIIYKDKKDPTIFVTFDVKDGKGILEGDEKFVIWTTTPWTIPANLAISLHPQLEYVVVKTSKGKLIVAKSLVDKLLEKFELENEGILNTFKGKELEYITTIHPLYPEKESLIIVGEHVTDEDGTGCVHTAPGHGLDDYYVGLKYGLEAYCPVDEKGCMTSEAGVDLEGLFVEDCSKKVNSLLFASGHILKIEDIVHPYPHDDRLKKPVIYRATVQWFTSIEKIREELLEQIKSVKWENDWGEARLYSMVKERTDWCISRQRLWGVPIPIIFNEDKSPIIEKEVFEHIEKLIGEYGSNVWFEREAKDLLPEGYTNEKSPNGKFTKETDIMDVWFDSGSSHQELRARGLEYPADLYFEGSDQYRGWFNSSLIIGTAINGRAPYKSVLSHGYVNDSKGVKMSKSIGNVVDPIKIINQKGADIFRLWAATVDFKQDMRIGDDNLKQVSEQYRKVRNTFRFMLGNVNPEDFNPKTDMVAYEDLSYIDKYIMVRLDEVVKGVRNDYMKYDYVAASSKMVNLMTNELSSYYLDYSKDILYIYKKDSLRRRQVQSVIWNVIDSLCKLWAPLLVYTMDEIWSVFNNDEANSVHYTHFPEVKNYDDASDIKERFKEVNEFRDIAFKALEVARADKIIGKPLEAKLTIYAPKETIDLLNETFENKVYQWLIVSKVEFVESEETKVEVSFAKGEVCPRCWNISEEYDEDGLCPRCQKVLA